MVACGEGGFDDTAIALSRKLELPSGGRMLCCPLAAALLAGRRAVAGGCLPAAAS